MLVKDVMNSGVEEVRGRRPVGWVKLAGLAARVGSNAMTPGGSRRFDFIVLEHDEDLVDAVVRAELTDTQHIQLRPAEQDAGRS